jgi:acetate kinase
MKILVFNCGSSSLKYRLIEMPAEKELAAGEAQRVGAKTSEPARIICRHDAGPQTAFVPMPTHEVAFEEVMKRLPASMRPEAFGQRLVHGGSRFSAHVVIDHGVVTELEALSDLAPLHNPPAVRLIRACRRAYPNLPQVAVFDTVFHSTIPEYARTYALPRQLAGQLGLRKFGFHGTSHQYVATEAARILERPLETLRAVSCHLGSGGASLCAIVNGRSVDNTMGYSPLQGLVMSTRCGDLDAAVALRLLLQSAGDPQPVESLLNHHSGVLGMSGTSADIRDVLRLADQPGPGQDQLRQTLEVYVWRIRKYLGSYLAVTNPADAVIFTDTIGETVPQVRWAVCAGLGEFGLAIDPDRNERPGKLPAHIATCESPTRVLVIQTNEELSIARNVYALLVNGPHQAARGAA